MTRFNGYSEAVSFIFELLHKGKHPLWNGSKIVIFQLLIFGRCMTKEGSAGQHQVWPGKIQRSIYKEILLLPSQRGINFCDVGIKKTTNIHRCPVDGVHSFQQWSFKIKGFTGIGDKYGRNTEGPVHDKRGRRGIPGCISTRFEGTANTAAGETGGIGFLLRQFISSELFDTPSAIQRINEGVMLFGSGARQWQKPMGIMGCALVDGPCFDSGCDLIGDLPVDLLPLFYGVHDLCVGLFREVLPHSSPVKGQLPKIFRGFPGWKYNINVATVHCDFNGFKPEILHISNYLIRLNKNKPAKVMKPFKINNSKPNLYPLKSCTE